MSQDSGSEPRQRTVAELLAQYGDSSSSSTPKRRRRRAEDDSEETAPQAIIDRVLSDSGRMRPVHDEARQATSHPGVAERPAPAEEPPAPPQPGPAAAAQPGAPQPGLGREERPRQVRRAPERFMGAPAPAAGSAERTQQQPPVRQPTVQRPPVQPPPQPPEQPPPAPGAFPTRLGGPTEGHTEELPAVTGEQEASAHAGEPPAGLRTHSRLGRGVAASDTAAEETQVGMPPLDGDYADGENAEDYEEYTDDESDEDYDASSYDASSYDADSYDAEAAEEDLLVDEDEFAGHGPSTGREWLMLSGMIGAGVVGGALVWLGFDWLWGTLPQVALIPALAVIGGMVWIVRRVRNDDDLQTTVLSVLVGLIVTVSPAALLLLER